MKMNTGDNRCLIEKELDEQIKLNRELAEEYVFLWETFKKLVINWSYGHKN